MRYLLLALVLLSILTGCKKPQKGNTSDVPLLKTTHTLLQPNNAESLLYYTYNSNNQLAGVVDTFPPTVVIAYTYNTDSVKETYGSLTPGQPLYLGYLLNAQNMAVRDYGNSDVYGLYQYDGNNFLIAKQFYKMPGNTFVYGEGFGNDGTNVLCSYRLDSLGNKSDSALYTLDMAHLNTVANGNHGQSYLGRQSKNAVVQFALANGTITHHNYTYDGNGRMTTVTIYQSDTLVSAKQFTYY